MKKILILLVVLVMPVSVFASGFSGSRSVHRVESSETFFTVYSDSGEFDNPDQCEDSEKVIFWAEDYPEGIDRQLSIALSAMMAEKKVGMWVNGCKMGPWGKTLPKPSTINVYK